MPLVSRKNVFWTLTKNFLENGSFLKYEVFSVGEKTILPILHVVPTIAPL